MLERRFHVKKKKKKKKQFRTRMILFTDFFERLNRMNKKSNTKKLRGKIFLLFQQNMN